MNTIEQIIFDTLASGRAINLPEVGSLSVSREPAKMISKKAMRGPYNRVVFSREENRGAESVTEVLSRQMEAWSAEERYKLWLSQSRGEGNSLEISGVGVLKSNFFYPSVGLNSILNPEGEATIKLRRGATGRKLGIALGVIVSAAVVIFFVIALDRYVSSRRGAGTETGRVAAVGDTGQQQALEERGQSTIYPAGSTTEAAVVSDDAGQVEDRIQSQLEEYARTTAVLPPSGELHHLVAGVFSTAANADRFIASDELGLGRAAYGKVTNARGQTLVTVYSSADKASVDNRRRELRRVNSSLWVYTEEK